MATEASMRTYLRDVIGITDPIERRQAIQDEGLTTITDFAEFEQSDIETLCSSVRKPGGTVANPNAAAANTPATIPNPGHNIPAICEKRLVNAAYVAKIYLMIGRTITQQSLGRAKLKKYEEHRLLLVAHEDPVKLPAISKSFGIMRALDLVPSHLRERLGVCKVALSYVIRAEPNPGPVPDQEPNDVTSAGYASIMDELIDFAPHTGDAFKEDNANVYQILQDLVSGTSHETSVKTYQRSRDGGGAYLALCQHNLGSSKWEKIFEDAETYVTKREWNGKNPRFNLKSHINKHRVADNEMVRAKQFIDVDTPNGYTRVTRLLKSITSRDPAIIAAKTHIQGNQNMRQDFEQAADFLLLTAPSSTINEPNHRISATTSNTNGDGGNIELRYYSKKEYGKLSKAQKSKLYELRQKKKESSKDDNTTATSEVAALRQQMTELESRLVAAINTQSSNTSSNSNPLSNPLTQRNQS